MKRSEALRSLSREHHQALVVAQRLRRAEHAASAGADFLEFWETEGQRHFQIEEDVLLPYWGLLGSVNDEAAARLSREHLAIRSAALAFSSEPPSLEAVRSLGSLLSDHVRFEDRELFPLIEEDLSSAQLERLADAVAQAEEPGKET